VNGLVIEGENVLAVGQGVLANSVVEFLSTVSIEVRSKRIAVWLTYVGLLVNGHQALTELGTLSLVEVVGVVNETSIEFNAALSHL
jgi:hypothetical protein